MADDFKALAAADLPIVSSPPEHVMSPMSAMVSAEEALAESLIYKVPLGRQAIIKLIVCTSDDVNQDVTLRCYDSLLGIVPLFGPVELEDREWAEWTGTLTLAAGGEIRGAITGGSVSIGVYGMERSR